MSADELIPESRSETTRDSSWSASAFATLTLRPGDDPRPSRVRSSAGLHGRSPAFAAAPLAAALFVAAERQIAASGRLYPAGQSLHLLETRGFQIARPRLQQQ